MDESQVLIDYGKLDNLPEGRGIGQQINEELTPHLERAQPAIAHRSVQLYQFDGT